MFITALIYINQAFEIINKILFDFLKILFKDNSPNGEEGKCLTQPGRLQFC